MALFHFINKNNEVVTNDKENIKNNYYNNNLLSYDLLSYISYFDKCCWRILIYKDEMKMDGSERRLVVLVATSPLLKILSRKICAMAR